MSRWPPAEERFFSRVAHEPNTGCWLWFGATTSTGYGTLSVRNVRVLAHRFSYELHHAEIPAGMLVCHTCDVRCCVNPEHLFLGDATANAVDASRKGRLARGERHATARLTRADVARIRRASHRSTADLARELRVSPQTVWAARVGKTWRHVPATYRGERIVLRGNQAPAAKLTEEDVRVIRASQDTQRSLAARFGVSQRAIMSVIHRETWAHVR